MAAAAATTNRQSCVIAANPELVRRLMDITKLLVGWCRAPCCSVGCILRHNERCSLRTGDGSAVTTSGTLAGESLPPKPSPQDAGQDDGEHSGDPEQSGPQMVEQGLRCCDCGEVEPNTRFSNNVRNRVLYPQGRTPRPVRCLGCSVEAIRADEAAKKVRADNLATQCQRCHQVLRYAEFSSSQRKKASADRLSIPCADLRRQERNEEYLAARAG